MNRAEIKNKLEELTGQEVNILITSPYEDIHINAFGILRRGIAKDHWLIGKDCIITEKLIKGLTQGINNWLIRAEV